MQLCRYESTSRAATDLHGFTDKAMVLRVLTIHLIVADYCVEA